MSITEQNKEIIRRAVAALGRQAQRVRQRQIEEGRRLCQSRVVRFRRKLASILLND